MKPIVQSLRGLAVMMVIAFHFTSQVPNGYLGVDIFFLISGFVLHAQFERIGTSTSSIDLRNNIRFFLWSRYKRLWPALLICISLALVSLGLFADSRTLEIAQRQAFFTFFGIGNISSYSLSGDYFHPESNPLIHLWSLSAEIQIYLLVLSLVVFAKLAQVKYKSVLFSIMILDIYLILFNIDLHFYGFLGVGNASAFKYYSPFSHLWEFILGIFCAEIQKGTSLKWRYSNLLFLLYIPIGLVHNFAFGFSLCILITGVILICQDGTNKSRILNVLHWVGDRSYSLYLIHLPLFFVISFLFIALTLDINTYVAIVSLIFTLLIANVNFKYIENKFRKFGNMTLRSNTVWLAVSVTIILIVSKTISIPHTSSNLLLPSTSTSMYENCTELSESAILRCGKGTMKRILVVGDSHAGTFADISLKSFNLDSVLIDISSFPSCPFLISNKYISDDSCIERNSRLRVSIQKNKYDLIITSFRNPDFREWTPGAEALKQYSLDQIKDGILFMHKNSKKLLVFAPNSELVHPTLFLTSLDSSRRLRSFSNVQMQVLKKGLGDNVVKSTDNLLCLSSKCSSKEIQDFLSTDGNHLNDLAQKHLFGYLKDLFSRF